MKPFFAAVAAFAIAGMADAGGAAAQSRVVELDIVEGRIRQPVVLKLNQPVALLFRSVSQQPGDVIANRLFAASDPTRGGLPKIRLMSMDSAAVTLTPRRAGSYPVLLSGFRFFNQPGTRLAMVEVVP